tara:strand:- start:878 stop:1213 length:336 start_codon:yes stop_codon:yes gene_type:complete
VVKLKDVWKYIKESSGLSIDGEPDTGFIPRGKKRTLGTNKGKPDLWFDKGGYTQVDFPKADDIFGKNKDGKRIKPDLKVKKTTTPEQETIDRSVKIEVTERIKLKDIFFNQ